MSDVDQHIRSALENVARTAPEPVPITRIANVGQPIARRRSPLWWSLVPAAAVGIWLAVAWFGSSTDPAPVDRVQVETVDDPNTNQPVVESESVATTIEGRWLSESIPALADQVPTLSEEELWAALDRAEPSGPASGALPDTSIPGLGPDRLRWEGLLFPSTYRIGENESADDVAAKMHAEFLAVLAELGYDEAEALTGRSAYELVIIASMIEADAFNNADRPKIARVIYNRLAMDMPLALDATYRYAAQDRDLQFTAAILDEPGPYNSRTAPGLPPTPIGAPGRASLEAAINPVDGPWLFYVVADEDGNHTFSESLEQFSKDVATARDRGLIDG